MVQALVVVPDRPPSQKKLIFNHNLLKWEPIVKKNSYVEIVTCKNTKKMTSNTNPGACRTDSLLKNLNWIEFFKKKMQFFFCVYRFPSLESFPHPLPLKHTFYCWDIKEMHLRNCRRKRGQCGFSILATLVKILYYYIKVKVWENSQCRPNYLHYNFKIFFLTFQKQICLQKKHKRKLVWKQSIFKLLLLLGPVPRRKYLLWTQL